MTGSEDHGRIPRRASRRSLLKGAAGLAGLALIGCDETEGTPVTGTPGDTLADLAPDARMDPGGSFRDSGLGAIAGADPHRAVYHGTSLVRQVYLGLLRMEVLRPDIGLHHELAEEHELPDEVTAIFHLRPNARLHSNTLGIPERAMDAEDVIASFDRIQDPGTGANGLPFFARWVDSYDAPDEHTVRLTTRGPYAWMLASIGNSLESLIVPREVLAMGSDVFSSGGVGAGPFVLESMEEGYGYALRRHPRFYERGVPRLEVLERRLFQDLATHEDALRTREIDYWLSADASVATALENDIEGVSRIEHGTLEFNSFWMRVDAPPWNDARVRRAVNRAINRQQYIDVIGGGSGQPMGALAPAFGAYALSAEEVAALQPYDPEEAHSLFSAAGVTELPFVYPLGGDTEVYVNLLAGQLEAAGVQAMPQALDPSAWLQGYVTSAHTASLSINQSYKTPDAALLWHRSGGPTGSGQYETGLNSRDLDQLIDAAATTLDELERIEIYHEAQRVILESDPAVLNFFNLTQHALHYEDTHGLTPGPGHMGEFLYRQVWVETPEAT